MVAHSHFLHPPGCEASVRSHTPCAWGQSPVRVSLVLLEPGNIPALSERPFEISFEEAPGSERHYPSILGMWGRKGVWRNDLLYHGGLP